MQHSFVSSFLIVEENQKSEPSPLSRKGSDFYYSVRITGLEPARRRHWTLKPARLPIPPYPLKIPLYFNRYHAFCQCRQTGHIRAIPHNSKCRYGERGAAAAKPKAQIILDAAKVSRRQWRKQRTEAGAAVAECEGLLPPKHDAGTATRHCRAFWQRRCRAAAAEAVLKPLGGNCAVLPYASNTLKIHP